VLTFFFMALGGFFGLLEEVIPLVPIMIALAYSLGWDSLTGLGFSILAANVGFSTAVFNFFTIGIAQQLAGLPLFSGWVPGWCCFWRCMACWRCFSPAMPKKVVERSPAITGVRGGQPGKGRFLMQPGWFQRIVGEPKTEAGGNFYGGLLWPDIGCRDGLFMD
jgi:hypothetical protein